MTAANEAAPLAGQVALVTGASRGIGRAIAERLELRGATVATVQRGAGPGLSLRADLSSPEAAAAAVTEAVERLGSLHICVHAAGVTARVPLLDLELDDWRRVIDLNLTAAFAVTTAAARQFRRQDSGGAILHVSSMLATFGGVGVAAYSASKGGVEQLMRSQSNEWAELGIRVNAIAPGWIDTDFTAALRTDPTRGDEITKRIPTGRWGTAEEVADAAEWLLGPKASYVTGSVVTVDGGYASR